MAADTLLQTDLQSHPAADIFPLMTGQDFADLVADVRAHGLREAIILTADGRILDGRNRYRACREAGVDPRFEKWDGDDPIAFVVSLNLHRRHLNESQRGVVAAKIENFSHGGERKADQDANLHLDNQPDIPRRVAAEMLNVSTRTVADAKKVIKEATPELVEAVEQGKVAVSLAAKLTNAAPETQRAIVEKVNEGVKPIEAARQVKAESIEARRIEEPSGRYRVIYADPPWDYGNRMPPGSTEPRDYYPTMPLADICALPVRDMAEDNAVLFMWTTSPCLEEAFDVINAWGFAYKSSFVWDKVKHNMGHYNSVRHELLLIATRGACQPDVRKLFDSVVTEERTEHSRKPDLFYEIIDTIYPRGARVELFARREREGWARWGYEAPNA